MDQKVVLTQKICQIQLQEVETTKRDIVCIKGIFNILRDIRPRSSCTDIDSDLLPFHGLSS